MALVNKNIASAFNYAVFSRAVLNLDFDSQDIPSELYDGFRAVCGLARPSGKIEKRYPWSVTQPGTSEQVKVWDIFLKACACFAKQPDEGGVEPPAIGPRNRSWWYDHDKDTPPIYFNYFMKETLTLLHQGITPDWCKSLITDDTFVSTEVPGGNYSGYTWTQVYIYKAPSVFILYRAWLKTPGDLDKVLHLYAWNMATTISPPRRLGVYSQDPNSFDVATLTWNNQPAIGSLIASFAFPAPPPHWVTIPIGSAEAVCIKLIDESAPEDYKVQNNWFHSAEAPDPALRPFLT